MEREIRNELAFWSQEWLSDEFCSSDELDKLSMCLSEVSQPQKPKPILLASANGPKFKVPFFGQRNGRKHSLISKNNIIQNGQIVEEILPKITPFEWNCPQIFIPPFSANNPL